MNQAIASFQPLDERRCEVELSDRDSAQPDGTFSSRESATDHPIAQALFCVRGVVAVAIQSGAITLTKEGSTPWAVLEKPIRYAIATAVVRGEQSALAQAAAEGNLSDGQMYRLIEHIFADQVNPSIAAHGGTIELVDVQDAVAVVRMSGGCQGCGMASVTLRQGIETTLRRLIPGFVALSDITDHSAGANPYFPAR